MKKRRLICPTRMRHLERPFGWIPVWMITEGRWGGLSIEAKVVYTFLCGVSDREGMSCYSRSRISNLIHMSEEALLCATHELCRGDYICFDGCWYQVLALDRYPVKQNTAEQDIQRVSSTREDPWETKHIQALLKHLRQGASHD